MTHLEQILLHTQKLPEALQKEVLDFVEYLEVKNLGSQQEVLSDKDWMALSISGAMKGMEDEDMGYSLQDLKERFK